LHCVPLHELHVPLGPQPTTELIEIRRRRNGMRASSLFFLE